MVGGYALGDALGIGGMGVVYAAERAGREVAIKLLLPDHLADERSIRRLRDEARAARLVTHPNVVAIIELGEERGAPYLVMERARGVPLSILLDREGPFALGRAIAIAIEILAGLEAAHDAGIVHGDIKSDNILVEARPNGSDAIKIIDFGLAVREDMRPIIERDAEGCAITSGTPEYMAPEVIRGEGARAASDLYAVGVILYELVTGHPPFEGGTSSSILMRHLEDHVLPPSLRRPDRFIPIALERAIMRALEKEPRLRHASANAFAMALAAARPASECSAGAKPPARSASSCSAETSTGAFSEPRRRLAAGSHSGINDRVARCRQELVLAIERNVVAEAVTAALELARALVDEHSLWGARRELEETIDLLTGGAGVDAPDAPEPLWRLLLSLAALYHGLHDPVRARRAALAGYHLAVRHRSDLGRERASALLDRLGHRRSG